MCSKICQSQEEAKEFLDNLKLLPCPHCQKYGYLIRHGFLRGYDSNNQKEKSVRAFRVFCSNRFRADGCGKTFSIWTASKIKRLFLNAEQLWTFLNQAIETGNKQQAFRKLNTGLTSSAPYRIWKRFQQAQSAIRTALFPANKLPKSDAQLPEKRTLDHLEQVFEQHLLSPIAAFQMSFQAFFM